MSTDAQDYNLVQVGDKFHIFAPDTKVISVTPQYSHRNGETEPPTQHGWYWLKQKRYIPMMPAIVFVAKKRYKKEWFIFRDEAENLPVKDVQGQWWGPIMPPWESDD